MSCILLLHRRAPAGRNSVAGVALTSRPGEEGGHPFEVRGAFQYLVVCPVLCLVNLYLPRATEGGGRRRRKGEGRRKKDRSPRKKEQLYFSQFSCQLNLIGEEYTLCNARHA